MRPLASLLILTLAASYLPGCGKSDSEKGADSGLRMKLLSEAIHIHHDSHDEWPATLDDAKEAIKTTAKEYGRTESVDELLANPLTGDSKGYQYIPPTGEPSSKQVMLVQLRDGKPDFDLVGAFQDGSVREISEKERKQAVAATKKSRSSGAGTQVASSGGIPIGRLPPDTLSVVSVQIGSIAASDIGKALLKLPPVAGFFEELEAKPSDVQRFTMATGTPSDLSENDTIIVELNTKVDQEKVRQLQFEGEESEAVVTEFGTYYRMVDEFAIQDDNEKIFDDGAKIFDDDQKFQDDAADGEKMPLGADDDIVAKFPDDYQTGNNGHPDFCGRGKWEYYSSYKQNPSDPDANIYWLRWIKAKNRYESKRTQKGNTHPQVMRFLNPSPFPPHHVVARWRSGTTAGTVRVQGTWEKTPWAKSDGNGVIALIFLDGEEVYRKEIPKDRVPAIPFDLSLNVKADSKVDFVLDPKGDYRGDATDMRLTMKLVDGEIPMITEEELQAAADEIDLGDLDDLPPPTALWFPDAHSFVIANEPQIKLLMEGKTVAGSAFAKSLASLDDRKDVVALIATKRIREDVELLAGDLLPGGADLATKISTIQIAVDMEDKDLLALQIRTDEEEAAGQLKAMADLFMEPLKRGETGPIDVQLRPTVSQKGTVVKISIAQPEGLADAIADINPAMLREFMPGNDRKMEFAGGPDGIDGGPEMEPDGGVGDGGRLDAALNDNGGNDDKLVDEQVLHPRNKDFVQLSIPDQKITVFLPGRPAVVRDNIKADVGNVKSTSWNVKYKGADYSLTMLEYPKGSLKQNGDRRTLDEYRGGAVDAPRGILVDTKDGKYAGLESNDFYFVHEENPAGFVVYNRTLADGDVMFHMYVVGKDTPEAERKLFFDSFSTGDRPPEVVPNMPNDPPGPGDIPKDPGQLIQLANRDHLQPLALDAPSLAMTLTEDAQQLIVCHSGVDRISIVDVETMKVVKTIITTSPTAILSRGDELIVANRGRGTLTVFDRSKDWEKTKTVQAGDPNPEYLSAPGGRYYNDLVAVRCEGNGRDACPINIVNIRRARGLTFSNGRTSACPVEYSGNHMLAQSRPGSPNRYVAGVYDFSAASRSSGAPSKGQHLDSFPILYQVGNTPYWFGERKLYFDLPFRTRLESDRLLLPDRVLDVCYDINDNRVSCVALDNDLTEVAVRPLQLSAVLRDLTDMRDQQIAATIGDYLHLFLTDRDGNILTIRLEKFDVPARQTRTDRSRTVEAAIKATSAD